MNSQVSTQQHKRHASNFLSVVVVICLDCNLVSIMLMNSVITRIHQVYESIGKLLEMLTRVRLFRKKESLLARVGVEDSIWKHDSSNKAF